MRDPLAPLAAQSELRLIRAPWAPGLVLAFARWRGDRPALSPLGSGAGERAEDARNRALGELAENLSILPAAHAGPVPARDAAGRLVLADARALPGPGGLGSEGVAAGPDPQSARLAAFCERAERAALALWWQGTLPAHRAPDALCLPTLRAGASARQGLTLALELLPGLAVRLVVTCDPDGGRPSLGSAAHPEADTAAAAALREAMQAELAWLMPDHHPDRAERDLRAHGLAARLPSLHAAAAAAPPSAPATLPALLAALAGSKLAHGFADLTVPDLTGPNPAIPVWRFVCPDWPLARPLFQPLAAPP
ncbi:MAG: YcaO-like family protein [Gemmobacter sp.]|uniref:YcaO-like family protein n=1 Tax=Gemmobacter sp. TaxID=1898957 RepID=UPI001A437540|nr:YcaO-like family protein [Gemmobacter sp.]MBL8563574.1 YcaO-like family protein [Gemmobacter sp.]